jgi:transposase
VAASGFAALVCPSGHLARFVPDTAHEAPDLSAITGFFKWEQGQPPYPPAVLLVLLLYGYRRGIQSSRQAARDCKTTGLVKLGHSAVDDTNPRANASRHTAMC